MTHMNMWKVFLTLLIISSIGAGVYVYSISMSPPPSETKKLPPTDIVLTTPEGGSVVSSPLTIQGTAPGSWFLEATFPIEVRDEQGTVLGQGQAHAQGNWMTTDYVPFTASVTFTSPGKGKTGFIVFKNDNPSGLPENAKEFLVEIKF